MLQQLLRVLSIVNIWAMMLIVLMGRHNAPQVRVLDVHIGVRVGDERRAGKALAQLRGQLELLEICRA
jgi:hypothetical protein